MKVYSRVTILIAALAAGCMILILMFYFRIWGLFAGTLFCSVFFSKIEMHNPLGANVKTTLIWGASAVTFLVVVFSVAANYRLISPESSRWIFDRAVIASPLDRIVQFMDGNPDLNTAWLNNRTQESPRWLFLYLPFYAGVICGAMCAAFSVPFLVLNRNFETWPPSVDQNTAEAMIVVILGVIVFGSLVWMLDSFVITSSRGRGAGLYPFLAMILFWFIYLFGLVAVQRCLKGISHRKTKTNIERV
jgi:hypothetical protein